MSEQQYQSVDNAFRTGVVWTDDKERLLEHLSGLSNQAHLNTNMQHRDIIRGITINHLLLQKYIDSLERKSTNTQIWFIVLAVLSLVGTVVQISMDLKK